MIVRIRQFEQWCHTMRRRFAAAAVAFLAGALCWHVLFGANGMVAYSHKRTEYRKVQQEIESLTRENERLQQHIHSLKTDRATIEKEAREQLRYTRPGEMVFVLPQPATAAKPPMAAQKH